MTTFVPRGPKRYAHQIRGLKKLIETKGQAALLFDPGTGKTATTLDYMSVLALKLPPGADGVREARVLVTCPLAAVDTWVSQAMTYVADGIDVWAEVLGGSILEKGEALAARGGHPWPTTLVEKWQRRPKRRLPLAAPRALHVGMSEAWAVRCPREPGVTRREGPDALGAPGTATTPPRPRLVIEVVNLDAFSSRQSVGTKTMADIMLDAVKRYAPDLVVVDESHKIKGASSNVSRLMGRIGNVVPRRVILTGTVMPAGPLDVYAQWRFMDPLVFSHRSRQGELVPMSYGGFEDRYARKGGYMGYQVVGYQNLDEMQDRMALNAAVAKKSESLDLPPTTDAIVEVNLSAAEAKAYRQMKDDLAADLAAGRLASSPNRLTQILRLRQITSGHLPDDQGTTHTLGDSKVRTIASLVNDTLVGEDRVVVFGFFTHEIDALVKALDTPGTTVEKIVGGTPTESRMAIRARFKDKEGHPERIVLVAQIKTLSLAVNELVTACNAVFGSLSQQRDDYIQGRDRLDRIGQVRPVTFWHVLVPGSIDEVILKSHQDKTDLETAMLAYIRGDFPVVLPDVREEHDPDYDGEDYEEQRRERALRS